MILKYQKKKKIKNTIDSIRIDSPKSLHLLWFNPKLRDERGPSSIFYLTKLPFTSNHSLPQKSNG
jgi:hypothetical protein